MTERLPTAAQRGSSLVQLSFLAPRFPMAMDPFVLFDLVKVIIFLIIAVCLCMIAVPTLATNLLMSTKRVEQVGEGERCFGEKCCWKRTWDNCVSCRRPFDQRAVMFLLVFENVVRAIRYIFRCVGSVDKLTIVTGEQTTALTAMNEMMSAIALCATVSLYTFIVVFWTRQFITLCDKRRGAKENAWCHMTVLAVAFGGLIGTLFVFWLIPFIYGGFTGGPTVPGGNTTLPLGTQYKTTRDIMRMCTNVLWFFLISGSFVLVWTYFCCCSSPQERMTDWLAEIPDTSDADGNTNALQTCDTRWTVVAFTGFFLTLIIVLTIGNSTRMILYQATSPDDVAAQVIGEIFSFILSLCDVTLDAVMIFFVGGFHSLLMNDCPCYVGLIRLCCPCCFGLRACHCCLKGPIPDDEPGEDDVDLYGDDKFRPRSLQTSGMNLAASSWREET